MGSVNSHFYYMASATSGKIARSDWLLTGLACSCIGPFPGKWSNLRILYRPENSKRIFLVLKTANHRVVLFELQYLQERYAADLVPKYKKTLMIIHPVSFIHPDLDDEMIENNEGNLLNGGRSETLQ